MTAKMIDTDATTITVVIVRRGKAHPNETLSSLRIGIAETKFQFGTKLKPESLSL